MFVKIFVMYEYGIQWLYMVKPNRLYQSTIIEKIQRNVKIYNFLNQNIVTSKLTMFFFCFLMFELSNIKNVKLYQAYIKGSSNRN